jgi:hypothetical protein
MANVINSYKMWRMQRISDQKPFNSSKMWRRITLYHVHVIPRPDNQSYNDRVISSLFNLSVTVCRHHTARSHVLLILGLNPNIGLPIQIIFASFTILLTCGNFGFNYLSNVPFPSDNFILVMRSVITCMCSF